MSLWGCSVPRVAGWCSHSNGPGAAGWCNHSHCLEWLAGVATVILVGISQVRDMQCSRGEGLLHNKICKTCIRCPDKICNMGKILKGRFNFRIRIN